MKIRNFTPYLVMGLLGVVVGVWVGMRQIARETKHTSTAAQPDADHLKDSWRLRGEKHGTTEPAPAPPESARPQPTSAGPDLKPARADTPPTPGPPQTPAAGERPSLAGMPVTYAIARRALPLVGTDSDAEDIWEHAINNPAVSAQDRKNLIEDLNEAGLSDPKNPTFDDLPLILARLQLIESLVPHAMDRVNADAFSEAYKDLLNLAEVALGNETPAR